MHHLSIKADASVQPLCFYVSVLHVTQIVQKNIMDQSTLYEFPLWYPHSRQLLPVFQPLTDSHNSSHFSHLFLPRLEPAPAPRIMDPGELADFQKQSDDYEPDLEVTLLLFKSQFRALNSGQGPLVGERQPIEAALGSIAQTHDQIYIQQGEVLLSNFLVVKSAS